MGELRTVSGLLLILQSIIALILNRVLEGPGGGIIHNLLLLWPLKSFKFPHWGL